MNEQGASEHFLPFITGIEVLFGKPLFSVDPTRKPEIGLGFRRKSSLVIEGPPGSGKTAATLAICRSLMPEQAKRLYYLSTEVTKQRLFKNHLGFGWFHDKDPIFQEASLFFADVPRARMDRPLPSSAELMNEIFRGISDDRRKPGHTGLSLIIVDSLSGLLRDASTAGERRRLTEDFLERLETEFGNDLGLVFLTTESASRESEEIPLEQYVADYVIRLGYKEVAGGRRIRTWDVAKSHGTFMVTGVHTWDFFTEATEKTAFFDFGLREFIWGQEKDRLKSPTNPVPVSTQAVNGSPGADKTRVQAQAPPDGTGEGSDPGQPLPKAEIVGEPPKPATIVLYPQWSTYLADVAGSNATIRENGKAADGPSPYIWSGTPGLDELLIGDTEYWSRPDKWSQTNSEKAKWTPGLRRGETTLLLGASGTMKTWISIQFLAGNLHSDGEYRMESPEKVKKLQKTRQATDVYQQLQELRRERHKLEEQLKKNEQPPDDKKKLEESVKLLMQKEQQVREEAKQGTECAKRGRKEAKQKTLRETFYRPTLFLSFEGESSAVSGYTRTSEDLRPLFKDFVYISPASLHLNRLLFELRWVCGRRKVERVAIDGLADLLKCVDPKVRLGVTTALLRVVGKAHPDENGHETRPAVFITLELSPEDEILVPDFEGISAICDNVIKLTQIRLNDQMHKAVFVLKAQNRRHDRQVREVIVNPRDTGLTPGVRIQSGFEGFSEILSGSPQKAQVALQLFRENQAEDNYNKNVLGRLCSAFAFPVTLHAFSHSELSQFLDDARGVLGQVPATDIKVISLDEWWLRDLQRTPIRPESQEQGAGAPPSPLLRIDGFFALQEYPLHKTMLFPLQQRRSVAANQGLASEHWITEIEKGVRTTLIEFPPLNEETAHVAKGDPKEKASEEASSPAIEKGSGRASSQSTAPSAIAIDTELQAMPHYSDFGLFCLNLSAALERHLFHADELDTREKLLKALPSLWARSTTETGDENWFAPPQGIGSSLVEDRRFGTVADLLFEATERGQAPEQGFVFDMSRGESAVCFLMELAWSFGVSEDFLNDAAITFVKDKGSLKRTNISAQALQSVFRLLQYLVYHGLMLPFPSVIHSANAILSRQWYSTLNISSRVEIGGADAPGTAKMEVKSRDKTNLTIAAEWINESLETETSRIAPLPFFPVGMLPGDPCDETRRLLLAELVDCQKSLSAVRSRISAALEWIHCYRSEIARKQRKNLTAERLLEESAEAVEAILEKVNGEILKDVQQIQTDLEKLKSKRKDITPEEFASASAKIASLVETLRDCVSDPNSGLSGRQLRWEEWKPPKRGKWTAAERQEWATSRRPWVAAGMAMDSRDVYQMLRWLKIRLEFLNHEIAELKPNSTHPVALKGFGCSGSWMLGVLRNTHSPVLSWKLIEEMTSRESNRIRAEMGAGIPSRKDFYEFNGTTSVPRLPKGYELSWSDFLTQAGAKVRRRDRSVCPKVPLSQFSAYLRSQMIRCIEAAQEQRPRLSRGDSVSWDRMPDATALKRMNAVSADAVRQILLYIADEQKPQPPQSPEQARREKHSSNLCEVCPLHLDHDNSSGCGLAYQDNSTAQDS